MQSGAGGQNLFKERLIDLSTVAKQLSLRAAQQRIQIGYQFSTDWNGIATVRQRMQMRATATLTSDASRGWGCGAYWGSKWFMLPWSGPITECHITVKELVPIVLATSLWGKEWQGQLVQVWCDNSAVVNIVNHRSSREKQSIHLARCLAFIKAKFDLDPRAAHIKGSDNDKADALSRNNATLFLHLHPRAAKEPTPIPEALLDLLLVSKPDWMSQHWM